MESLLEMENKENVTRGCLKLNNHIYPVYEGVNTVGRNPDARINIKNLNISKHHAIVVIIDENSHYISDFESSNGTIVDSKKLIPLRLYKLENGASIKFGDVFCTYRKLDAKEVIRRSVEESQQCTESFYGANTQEVRLSNLPQGISFNEMPTQIFSAKELSINEMPTQVFNFADHESSSDSIDFVTMKKATESQAFCKNSNIEKTVSPDTSQNLNAGSDTDDDLVSTHASGKSSDIEVSSATSSQVQPVTLNSRKILDSDMDEEPLSQIHPVKTGKKNVINSDVSDSDTEEYVPNNKSKYHISDDSETDIEGDDKHVDTDLTAKQNDRSQTEDTSMGDFKLELNESTDCRDEKIQSPKKINKKILPQDHIYCQSFTETQDTQHVEEKKEETEASREAPEVLENTIDEELEDLFGEPAKKVSLVKKDEDSEATSSLPFLEDKETAEQTSGLHSSEEIKAGEDQHVDLKEEEDGEKIDLHSSGEIKDSIDFKDKEEDIFLQSTQTLDLSHEENDDLARSTKTEETRLDSISKKEDEIFLQPTQVLENSDKSQKASKSSAFEDIDDEIFLQPTQALENLHGEDKREDSLKNDESSSKTEEKIETQTLQPMLSEDKENEDELCLPPTQALEFLHRGESHLDTVSPTDKLLASMDEEALEHLLSDDKTEDPKSSSWSKKEDDVFLSPNRFREPSPHKKTARKPEKTPEREEEDSFIFQPTQALENMHQHEAHFNKVEDQLHEIFASQSLMCTQQLVDVLEVSHNDDIIEDSIIQETEKSLNLPVSAESVKDILGEGLDDEEIEDRMRVKSTPRTYSRKKDNKMKEHKEKSVTSVDQISKDEATTSKEETVRKSRRKQALVSSSDQELSVVDNLKKKDSKVDEEKSEGTKEVKRRKQNVAEGDKDESKSKKREESNEGEESTSETKKGKGRPKKQDIISEVRGANSKSSNDNSQKDKRINKSKESDEKNVKGTETKENPVEEVKGRGLRRRNLVSSDEHSETKEDEEKKIKGRKKQVTSTTQEKDSEGSEPNKSQSEDNEKKGRGRKKQNLIPPEEPAVVKKDEDMEGNTRKSRRKNIAPSPNIDFKEPEKRESVRTRSQKDIDEKEIDEGSNTRPKRKNDRLDETPSKKKTAEPQPSTSTKTGKKRASDSEDEFITKVPKIETPIKKSARLRKNRKTEDENSEEVITLTSVSSKPETVISISSGSEIDEPSKQRRLSANSKRQKKEEEKKTTPKPSASTSILATPERSRRVTKPKVVFTMMDSPEMESLVRQLGGSVVETVDACTVLVTQSVKRSLKLLCAVAQGKPICSPEWLHQCKKKFAFVDPWEYILVDKEAEKKWNFSLRESIKRGATTKLLENYAFQIIVNNGADVVKGGIEACGGKCVTRNLANFDADNLVIVSSENNKNKFSKIVKQNPKIIVVEAEAIFDGTLRQEFRFSDNLIT